MSSISNRDRKKRLQLKLDKLRLQSIKPTKTVLGMTITDVNVDLPPKGATPFFSQSFDVFNTENLSS